MLPRARGPRGERGRGDARTGSPVGEPRRTISCTTPRSDAVRTMTYSESRAHYAETLNAVVDDREEVIITRAGRDQVVIVSLDDYESLKETAYLLKSPENVRRLMASIDRLENGGGTERDLAE